MTAQHTKTPWRVNGNVIFDNNNYNVAILDTKENAAFIVRAVNNFSFLVDALNDIITSGNLTEAKSYAEKALRNVQRNQGD